MLIGSILQQLQAAHLCGQVGTRPLNFGVYYKNTLVALCHALEDAILASATAPLVITAFQRGKWYLEEADRYGAIADHASQVVILATAESGFQDHPTSQRSNVALVSLDPADPVAQEWHLIICSPNYTAMVLCQEISVADYGAAGLPANDLERKFYGFWTFEPRLVQETVALAIAHVGPYRPDLQTQLNQQLQVMAAAEATPPKGSLGLVVSRVVEYLQTNQQALHPETLDRNLTANELQALLRLAQIIDQSDLQNPNAAAEVASLAEAMGQLLDLPAWQLHRLRLAGLLHRLVFLEPENFGASTGPSPLETPLVCPLHPGAQVLRTMNRLRAIATIITHFTEHWDGSGLPGGLVGEAIPLESRILGLVAAFQQRLTHPSPAPGHPTVLTTDHNLTQALQRCQAERGGHWEPLLVDTLEVLVYAIKQGLTLPVALPKIAAGMWLLDSRSQESLWAIPPETQPLSVPEGGSES
ncbi:DICT sensory domain-containing protein [Neosynechococcus sphagnicola]|uniref:DICT sensory domain-containing protein n=1 Tax=Neosynechococcus sphagnicola TaxID=1501145 RepID=UPI00068C8032|nr:DICT sensory domain-containing protein [Neosynechococcus sphagnicola]